MAKTVVALYDNFNDAQRAVQDLVNAGFRRDDVSLVANDEARSESAAVDTATSAGEGAGIGAALGGLAGLLVGLGALAIPGIGPVLAAGPIVATLAGMGIGAVTGGLIGALMDAGIPEEEARYYAEGVRRGGTLLTVRTSDDLLQRATDILNQHNPADIHQRATQWQQAGWTGYDDRATLETRMTTGDVSAYDEDFRRNYQRAYADMGYNYDQYQPAYRYGFDLGGSENYQGRNWDEVEGQARTDWEQRHPNANWDQFRDAVHYGWERATGRYENDATMRPGGPTQGGQTYNQGQTGPAGDWQQHPTETVDQLPGTETAHQTTDYEHRPNREQDFAPSSGAPQGRPTQMRSPSPDLDDEAVSAGRPTQMRRMDDENVDQSRQSYEQGDPFTESPRLRQDDAARHTDYAMHDDAALSQGEQYGVAGTQRQSDVFGQGERFDHPGGAHDHESHPEQGFSDADLGTDINRDRGPAGGYESETRSGQAYNRDVTSGLTGQADRDLPENRGGDDFGQYQQNMDQPMISPDDTLAVMPPAGAASTGAGMFGALGSGTLSGGFGTEGYAAGAYDYDTQFRSHYDSNFASSGQSFDHYEPAYRYGYHMATDQRYRNQDWDHVEMQARQDWERDNPDSPWDKVKAAVRHAWESATRGGDQGDYR